MRGWLLSVAVLFAAALPGCMAVSATDNSKGVRSDSEVVVVNDTVYLVNKRTCEARIIDLSCAKPIPAKEAEETIEAGATK